MSNGLLGETSLPFPFSSPIILVQAVSAAECI
nr:MAG TPA: hypothetical protein [Caudoviricetes sp.]